MKNYNFVFENSTIRIDGNQNAIKVIEINGHDAKRLSDLTLHRYDLKFSYNCLTEIESIEEKLHISREALWRSSIIHFIKCFGKNNARGTLSAKKIFKSYPREAMDAFNYFDALRNKHFIHDENSYAQCITGAILNNETSEQKIEDVICVGIQAQTIEEKSINTMKNLIKASLESVITEFDEICNRVKTSLENETYEVLYNKKGVNFTVPTAAEIIKNRLK